MLEHLDIKLIQDKSPYFLIASHELSNIPINSRTACRISLIASGGALKLLISDKLSDLIDPTACRASCSIGSTLKMW